MHKRVTPGVVGTAAAALLVSSVTAAHAAGLVGGSDRTGAAPGSRTSADLVAAEPNAAAYPNLFGEAGHSSSEIDAKISAAWQQLFHGAPGSGNRYDGQTVYYQISPNMAYVEDIANQDVRSEGIGFGMMIAVQLGHKTEFDSLWNFAKSKMQQQSGRTKYFFTWHTDTSGNTRDTGIAPDGDQWIAAALAFAANRWGSDGQGIYNYQREASTIISAMWHQSDSGGVNMFDRNTSLPVFSPPWAVNYTDPSYCLPAFYKVFAKVVPGDAALWDKAYNAAIQLLQRAANAKTGLAPDYANFDGTPYVTAGNTDAYSHTFQEDAWRVIANVNVDAAWNGTKSWHTQYSNTLQKFFQSKGVTTYASRYRLDGTPVIRGQNDYEPNHAEGLVAMNSTSAISATETGRLAFVEDFWNTRIPAGKARYYDGLLYLLGLLYDSGNFKVW